MTGCEWTGFFRERIKTISVYGIFFIAIFCARLVTIHQYGRDIPFWDQWDAEADKLFKPWLESTLSFTDLVSAHNEHRILLTRLLALTLFEINGRVWSPLLEMRVNAAIDAAALTVLMIMLGSYLELRRLVIFLIGSLLMLAIPYGWENILSGFQSQFYFLLIISFAFIGGMAKYEESDGRWRASFFLGLLAPLTLASGALTLLAGAGVLGLKKKLGGRAKVSFVYISALIIAAVISVYLTPNVVGHVSLKAKSFHDFLSAFNRVSSWPLTWLPCAGLIINIPFFIVIYCRLKSEANRCLVLTLLGLGFWLFLQCVSVAYARADSCLSSRYLEIYSIGAILNIFSALYIFQSLPLIKLFKKMLVLWLVIMFASYGSMLPSVFSQITAKGVQSERQYMNVRKYVMGFFGGSLPSDGPNEIPYPDPVRLKLLLDDPLINEIYLKKLMDNNRIAK